MKIKGEHWLRHAIVVHPFQKTERPDDFGNCIRVNHSHWHTIKVFDFPAWITLKWAWYINYYAARVQVRFPKHHISRRVSGYWPDAEADAELIKKRQISAAKAQMSKVLNVMEERKVQLSGQLFQDEESDPIMIQCRIKLEEKKFKLNQIIM